MKLKDSLPIGSIVTLQGIKRKIMVFGFCQKSRGEDKVYDYIGVVYPEGHIDSRLQVAFNQKDIEDVIFRGYEDVERETFIKVIDNRQKGRD